MSLKIGPSQKTTKTEAEIDFFIDGRMKKLKSHIMEKTKDLHEIILKNVKNDNFKESPVYNVHKESFSLPEITDNAMIYKIIQLATDLLLKDSIKISIINETEKFICLNVEWNDTKVFSKKIDQQIQKLLSCPLSDHTMKNNNGVRIILKDIQSLQIYKDRYLQGEEEKGFVQKKIDYLENLMTLGIEVPDEKGETPLHGAAHVDDVEVLTELIKRGANVDAKEPNFNGTVLHVAIHGCSPNCVKAILEHNPSLKSVPNMNSFTPLQYVNSRLSTESLTLTNKQIKKLQEIKNLLS